MRRSCCRRLLPGLGLLVLALALGAGPVVSQNSGAGEGLVLALYYAGYSFNSWVPQLCDQPAPLYDSSSSETIDRQIRQAREIGFDAFVQVWNGPELARNPTEMNLRTLLERARMDNFEVAVLVDLSGGFLDTADEVETALVALRDRHTAHDAYLKVAGRPIIFFLGQHRRLTISQWEALRAKVDPGRRMIWIAEGDSTASLGVFDGLYIYDLAQTTQIGALLSNVSNKISTWNSGQAVPAYWVATVIPGYDNSAVVDQARPVLARMRGDGSYYRQNWHAAMASDPAWIMVRSFNEWRYCTQIEPSAAYGSAYLDLTSELVSTYRESLLPPTPTSTAEPTEAATSTVTPEPTVTETSTITDTATMEPVATETLTPTLTPTATATPFRLSTPTPSPPPSATRLPGQVPTLAPGAIVRLTEVSRPGNGQPHLTPVPRLPVEGASRRRCSLLPLLLPAVALLVTRRSHRR